MECNLKRLTEALEIMRDTHPDSPVGPRRVLVERALEIVLEDLALAIKRENLKIV